MVARWPDCLARCRLGEAPEERCQPARCESTCTAGRSRWIRSTTVSSSSAVSRTSTRVESAGSTSLPAMPPPYPLAFRRVLPDRKPNYGERYRAGEVISSSIAESAGNQVISKRMVKKQQMRWSPRGAHLLLQLRTRVLNDPLADDFHRWHPGFTHVPDRQGLAA